MQSNIRQDPASAAGFDLFPSAIVACGTPHEPVARLLALQSGQSIGTAAKPAKQSPAFGQNEVRSIDWLSRSNETLIRIGRPAPSDEQLIALQVAIIRFLARLKDFPLDVFRRVTSRQIQPY